MAEHLSDEEELEKLKQWWRESGKQTLATVVLVIAGYFGWQGWQNHQQQQAYQASDIYQQMVEAAGANLELSDDQRAEVIHFAVTLIDQHGGSQYGHYARLLMARLAVEDDDLESAQAYLKDVMDDADQSISLIARLRLARVEAAMDNLDNALALLNAAEPGALESSYAEVRGDIHVLKGDSQSAYDAYNQALAALPEDQSRFRPLLEMKRSQAKSIGAFDQGTAANGGDS